MIPEGEFANRVERSQRAVKEKNLKGWIVYTAPDVRYVSNYNTLGTGSAMVLIPAEGDPTLLIDQEWDLKRARDVSSVQDTRATSDFTKDLPKILKEKKLVGNIGVVGWASFPTPIYIALRKELPKFKFQDSTEQMRDLRMKKSPAELELLQDAAKLCDEGARAATELISPDKTELELAIEVEVAMKRAGASELSFPTILGSGQRTTLIVPEPTKKKIEKGDLILMDLGGRAEGYCGDISRTKQCGSLSQAQKDLFEVVVQMNREGIEAVRPGVKAFELHEVVKRVARESGYEKNVMHMTGHGLGLEEHEKPIIETEETPLVTGLVHTIEPGLYVQGVGGVRIEDMVLVTETGRKVLTSFSRDP
jgi:Xaa-Pro dipeptidase